MSVDNMTQFADQVRLRLIYQLINGISRVLQKLLRYFNGTIICHYYLSLPVLLVFCLSLNELVIALAILKLTFAPLGSFIGGSSLQHCHKLPGSFK